MLMSLTRVTDESMTVNNALIQVRRELRSAVCRDQQVVAERMEQVRPVPGLGRRDPTDHLSDQRDRIAQCPLLRGGPRPRSLPQQRSVEVSLPRDALA